MPAGMIQELRAICKKHTKESPYVPPLERGPGSHPNRWKPRCFVIPDLLRNPVFWQEVYELLLKQADRLEVTSVTPQRRSVQQEPRQFYLLRRLKLHGIKRQKVPKIHVLKIHQKNHSFACKKSSRF